MNGMKKFTALAMALSLSLSPCAMAQKTYELKPASETMPAKVTLPAEAFELDYDWSAQNPAVKETKLAGVYDRRLDQCQYLTVAEIEGCEDVPYVSVREYLRGLFANTVTFQMQEDKKAFIINRNGVNVVLDLDNPSVYCNAWEWFMGQPSLEGYPEGIIQPNEFLNIRHSLFDWETSGNDSYTISLDYDGIRLIVLDQDVLMPFLALQNTFALQILENESIPIYNGDNFYTTGSGFEKTDPEKMTPYEKAYFSGRFCHMEKTNEAYAKYNYACLCLMIDHFFGHKEQLGITSFDAWVEKQGLKELLLSEDPLTYLSGLKTVLFKLFDSGHDGITCSNSVFGSAIAPDLIEQMEQIVEEEMPELTEEEQLTARLEKVGPNVAELMYSNYTMQNKIPEEYKDPTTGEAKPTVAFENDTAFIFFCQFDQNLERESFYTSLPTEADESTSTFAFFYNAFAKIKEHPEIRNVVLDLSANIGGSCAALAAVLGFISPDGEVKLSCLNTISDSYRVENYRVDTNLDGDFNEEDGYGGQYDFYILTSPSSYSCANALSYFSQQYGLTKIMGKNPGGGDCTVFEMIDAFGFVCLFSGYLKLGRTHDGIFVSDEKDVTVDLPFEDRDLYFDRPAIVNMIHEYNEER